MIEPSDAEPEVDVREASAIRRPWRRPWLAVPIVAAVALGAVSVGSDQGSSHRRLDSGPLPPPVSIDSTGVVTLPDPALTVGSAYITDTSRGPGSEQASPSADAGEAGSANGNPARGSTTTTTTSTTVPATTLPPKTLMSVGLTAPDPAAVDAMLGFDSAPDAVAEALQLSPSTAWIENTRVARIFLNVVPYLWQVGDGNSLVVTRDEGWQGRLARSIAEELVAQGFWYGDPHAPISEPLFHAETGFTDVHIYGVGQVAVGPDALVYVMTPAEWQAIPPVVVPPLLAGLWRLPEVEALGFVASDDWWTEWNILGLGATEVSSTFVGPASLDQRRVLAALCGAGAPITTTVWGSDDDGGSTTYLGCERDGTAWNIGVEVLGPEMQSFAVLRLAVSDGDVWPYVGATGPDL